MTSTDNDAGDFVSRSENVRFDSDEKKSLRVE